MASLHCHCHLQQQNHHQRSTCHCCCCSSSAPPPHSHHSPTITTTTTTDPLLQAIASQLLQSSSQSHLFSHYLNIPQQQHHYQHQPQQHHHHQQQPPHRQQRQQQQTQALFDSLIRRIDALESSLHTFSTSPSSPGLSLRDLAARTIQTHFRAFLVRRSRTLRHLKHLAVIKSNFNVLKSSLSEKTHFNYQSLSQKAMGLLHKLDSIQGGDPMIRDGKRSISKDLVRFLEFVDGVLVKSKRISSKPRKNVKFADEISESRVHVDTQKPIFNGDVIDIDDQQELVENLCRRVEEIEGFSRFSEENREEEEEEAEADMEHEGFDDDDDDVGNGGRKIRKNVKGNCGNGSHFQGQNGNFVFSPPLPVQMEPRKDVVSKRER